MLIAFGILVFWAPTCFSSHHSNGSTTTPIETLKNIISNEDFFKKLDAEFGFKDMPMAGSFTSIDEKKEEHSNFIEDAKTCLSWYIHQFHNPDFQFDPYPSSQAITTPLSKRFGTHVSLHNQYIFSLNKLLAKHGFSVLFLDPNIRGPIKSLIEAVIKFVIKDSLDRSEIKRDKEKLSPHATAYSDFDGTNGPIHIVDYQRIGAILVICYKKISTLSSIQNLATQTVPSMFDKLVKDYQANKGLTEDPERNIYVENYDDKEYEFFLLQFQILNLEEYEIFVKYSNQKLYHEESRTLIVNEIIPVHYPYRNALQNVINKTYAPLLDFNEHSIVVNALRKTLLQMLVRLNKRLNRFTHESEAKKILSDELPLLQRRISNSPIQLHNGMDATIKSFLHGLGNPLTNAIFSKITHTFKTLNPRNTPNNLSTSGVITELKNLLNKFFTPLNELNGINFVWERFKIEVSKLLQRKSLIDTEKSEVLRFS